MSSHEKPATAPSAPDSISGHPDAQGGGESRGEGRTAAEAAWSRAHAHALSEGIDNPEAFADDYAAMIDERQHETRYPDEPPPSPADFLWP